MTHKKIILTVLPPEAGQYITPIEGAVTTYRVRGKTTADFDLVVTVLAVVDPWGPNNMVRVEGYTEQEKLGASHSVPRTVIALYQVNTVGNELGSIHVIETSPPHAR